MIENDKIKISVLVIGAVIFMAYINQYAYYLNFHIDISNYIEISEVFTPFIDDLTAVIICILLSMVVVKGWVNRIENKRLDENKSKIRRFIDLIYDRPTEVLISVNLFYIGWVLFFFDENFLKYFILIYVGVYAFIHLFALNNLEIEEYKKSNSVGYYAISMILIIFYCHCGYTVWKTKNVSNNYKKIKYKFLLINGDSVETNKDKTYLGRTKNKFFIYNTLEDKTSAYNTSDIKIEEVIKIK